MLASGPDYQEAAAALWSARDPASFEGLVHYASLAANSHNSQPWRFRKTTEGVAILPDLARALPEADGDNHHLFASLGCAAENLVLAAGASGRSAALVFDPSGGGSVRIALGHAGEKHPLFDAILERQCTRSAYVGRTVPAPDLARLAAATKVGGTDITIVEDRARVEQVLELILLADAAQVSNPGLRCRTEILAPLQCPRSGGQRRRALFRRLRQSHAAHLSRALHVRPLLHAREGKRPLCWPGAIFGWPCGDPFGR